METGMYCKTYFDENAPGYVVEYRGDFKGEIDKVNYACGDIITDKLAVVSVEEKDMDRLRKDVPSIVFIEPRGIYVLQDISPLNVDNINEMKINPYLDLTGRGVLVGMIDTGIDYLNQEFIREDDTSRIIRIWDQTIQGKHNQRLYIGREYSNDDINEAIKAYREGKNPYDIVASKDEIGHGTSMAGIIGARGYNAQVEGIANECEFIIVKLLPSLNYTKVLRENNIPFVPVYNNSEVIAAIEYLRATAEKLRKPIIIYLGVGSYNGSRDGYSITDRFITSVASKRGVVFVIGTGNSGNDDGHVTDFILNQGDSHEVELLISREIKIFKLYIWIQRPNRMSLNILAPTGEETGIIHPNIYSLDERTFYLVDTKIKIRCYDPDNFTGHQVYELDFTGIKIGIWRFRLIGNYITNGRYDIWLQSKNTLPDGTKFLNPNPYNTLTVPSAAKSVITVCYYDNKNNAIVASSGKGFNTNGLINPDIATVGIGILTISNEKNKVTSVSGSSAATAIVVGVCALLLQWGIIDGNDPTMYSTKIRSLLIYAADRDEIYEYPNESQGYGRLNFAEVFRVLGGNYRSKIYIDKIEFVEYYVGSLYVRAASEMISK